MQYHYFPNSHWSRAISLVIAEKGLEPERHFVDIRKNANFEPAYMRLNPKGVVPTLVCHGQTYCGSPNIAAHLDEHHGPSAAGALGHGPTMLSDDAEEKALTDELTEFPLMYLSYQVWRRGLSGENSAAILDDKIERAGRYAELYPDLRDAFLRKKAFFESFLASLLDAREQRRVEASCRATLARIEARLAGGAWLGGERFCFADAIAASILWRLYDAKTLDEWTAEGPLAEYFARLQERPSFKAVWRDDPLLQKLR